VVTTVRSEEKAQKIKDGHPSYGKDKLDIVIVPDIAQEGAFEEAVKSNPPFEAVIHTASPFHFKATDVQKDLLDPAVIGTTGILKSIKKHAPTVKRVVITSSFAAVVDHSKGTRPEHTYSEADWNPITHAQALQGPGFGYPASKAFAERAAWDFVENEKPNFDLCTMNPPLVFGPIVHYLNSLSALNTSNERLRDFIQGTHKDTDIPESRAYLWVDVRDLAEAHVKGVELEQAGGKRFFTTAGFFSNRQLVEIIRKNFPQYKDTLPNENAKGGDLPQPIYKIDNSRSKEVLSLKYIPLEKSVVDTVKSFQNVGA